MDRPNRLLFLLLIVYATASLVHFVHNAEFLGDYPGLPDSWSRAGVYLAWIGMTAIGGLGALLVYRGRESIGLMVRAPLVWIDRTAGQSALIELRQQITSEWSTLPVLECSGE